MQKASYTNVQTGTGGVGKYPLSTQTLDFIQQQILLLQRMVTICGGKVILKEPDGTNEGFLAIDGEILPCKATPKLTANIKFVIVKTTKQDIVADGETYKEARIVRTAEFATSATVNSESYPIGDFQKLSPNTQLAELIRNMPAKVLEYLSDTLASKMDRLAISGATQAKIDSLKTACVVNCKDSIEQCGYKNYNITVRNIGDGVEQILATPDGTEYYRVFTAGKWTGWLAVTDNMHIEVKTTGNTVYVRHGVLADDVRIILLRKKKRSGWRSTGGTKAFTKNRGKREKRQKKLQYVHYRGVILSKGEPGKWYVPKCIGVANKAADGYLIDREISGIASELVRKGNATKRGYDVLKLAGLRKCLTRDAEATRRHFKSSGYINMAVQVAKINAKGGKDAGGELAKMKYRVAAKQVKKQIPGTTSYEISYVYVKTFSVE